MTHKLVLAFLTLPILIFPLGELPDGSSLRASQAAVYTWQLVRWSDGLPLCLLEINHEGLPTGAEIYAQCGAERYQNWLNTPPCTAASAGGDTSTCTGVYLRLISVSQTAGQGQESSPAIDTHEIPPPEGWLNIQGCEFRDQSYICSQPPILEIQAKDSLPSEHIRKIEGDINAVPFACDGAYCQVELPPTDPEGALMGFYALSSSGVSSPAYQARLRAIQLEGSWQVNVLSDRWQGQSLSSCELIWRIFPPIGTLPTWLSSPQDVAALASDVPYTYLAGRLISAHAVNAAECARFGLEGNGYASPCGLEKARAEVDTWQDRFDPQIIAAGRSVGIPSQLLKNLIAQESQFWPGSYYLSPDERGLGQLTPEGADTLLLWDQSVYTQACQRVLHAETCPRGYPSLTEKQQTFVQGAVMQLVNADCPHCAMGIDLAVANQSIAIFAKALKANCHQVSQTITNLRGLPPGATSSYVDLWRFTLVNYHAGAGCLTRAINTVPIEEFLSWESIVPALDADCPGVSEYIRNLTDQ